MLLRIIPLTAVIITILALLFAADWRPYSQDGLNAPAHTARGWL
ncbi:hypothetical protein [Sulfitobacter aestuariivivens]|nr:hypothetical protein [Sulfitobacter aestuariivivens]